MESELEFDDFSSGSEFEDAELTCQNVEVFSCPFSDMKSRETGELNSPEIKVFSSPDTEKSTPTPFRCEVFFLEVDIGSYTSKVFFHRPAESRLRKIFHNAVQ